MVTRSPSSFGLVGTDWQQRINWERLRKYRLNRAREAMKRNGLGALLAMYDENVRYISSTVTPGWCRLKPGLRYALLCEGAEPVLFEQGDIGFRSIATARGSRAITCVTPTPGSRGRWEALRGSK
jgi:hypothetical protein